MPVHRTKIHRFHDNAIFSPHPKTNAVVDAPATPTVRPEPRSGVRILAVAPNPFRAATAVEYAVPSPGAVTVGVYDVAGRRVLQRRFVHDQAGAKRFVLDGSDLSTGIYFVRVVHAEAGPPAGDDELAGRDDGWRPREDSNL